MARPIFWMAMVSTVATLAAVENRQLDHYRTIIDRNPFGLKPVPPPPPPPEQLAPPPKKQEFYLSGISSVGYPKNPKTVYLVNKDARSGDRYLKLHLNEPQGDVSLEEINEKTRSVRIRRRGEEVWLNMKDDGAPAGAAAGPAPAMAMPMPGMAPGQIAPPPGGNGMPTPLPTGAAPGMQPANGVPSNNPNRRIPRTSAVNGAAVNGAAALNNGVQDYSNNNGGAASGFPTPTTPSYPQANYPAVNYPPINNSIPNYPANNGATYSSPTVNFGSSYPPSQNQIQNTPAASEPQIDPAEQYVRMKIQEAQNNRQGVISPPIPSL